MEITEVESSDVICVDLDGNWSVKIIDNYNNIDFLEIKNNLIDKETIYDVSDIFTHLVLPSRVVDSKGRIIREWHIADDQNLYTLNPLPQQYWNSTYNPPCYESYEETTIEPLISNYFDSVVSNY